MSYVEILIKLHDDVEKDTIPEKDKCKIMQLIHELQDKLWKYSA